MNKRILLVDDDSNILSSISRQLRGKVELFTATSGKEGVNVLKREKEFAAVVSDYQMPEMNGLQFLLQVKELSPRSVRMMLTGQADLESITKVINEGSIFRFLNKPCPPDLFLKNIEDAIEQYRLVNAEKELLSKTLSGSLQVMTEILILSKPQAFNRSIRIKSIVKRIVDMLKLPNTWQYEIAAMLSQIGCITVPDTILDLIYKNQPITPKLKDIFLHHVRTSSELIAKIPRMEEVARIIAYQEKYYNGSGYPHDDVKGDEIPLGARILRVAMDYDQMMQIETMTQQEAIEKLKQRENWYDPQIISSLTGAISQKGPKKYIIKEVMIDDLDESMYLHSEITTASGVIIGSSKQKITKTLIVTLKNYFKNGEIKQTVKVLQYED